MLEKFTKPSYGWDAGVVRVGVAALLRNGNIRVLIKKKLYENPNDSQLQAALRNIRQFDQIEIEIEKIDVPLDTLINTREALIRITGNKKIEETLSGISEAFENLSTDLFEKTRTIEIWATPADFPLHSDFVDGKDKIEEIVTLPNNARKVDEIYINIVTIENGYNKINEIYEFQIKWGQTYLEMKSHYNELLIHQHTFDQGNSCKQFIEDFNSAKMQRTISNSDTWKDLQSSKEKSALELTRIKNKWKKDAEEIIQTAIEGLPSLIQENQLDNKVDGKLRKPLTDFLEEIVDEENTARIANLPQRARTLIARLHQEIRKLIEVKTPPPPPTRQVEQVRVATIFLGRRISDESEWQGLLTKLDDKVKGIFNDIREQLSDEPLEEQILHK